MSGTDSVESRLSPGSSFGRYVVESRLARGGMGEVWLATARGPGGFQKRVVIKTVLPDLMGKPAYVQMLVTEASLAARLDHPNIVHVFDLGCVGGLYYIAMEYLSGRSLAQMLRRSHEMGQRLTLRVLLTMIATSCDGLQYAHDQADDEGRPLGLLHRDISPSNIMLTFAGRVTLLDFGVATAARGRYKTRSGTIKGKFHYLAPERVRGEPCDRRSDIYSLGVVLYQCLTLRWPFRARGEYELLRQIANEAPPPVRHYAPWVTPRLEQLVMRAMAHQATTRHQQARDLAADLRDYLRGMGPVAEMSELATYLTELFPEAPESIARRQLAAASKAEAVEIIFQAGDPIELDEGSASESVQLDQPDPAALAIGSPLLTDANRVATPERGPESTMSPSIPESSVSRAVDRARIDDSQVDRAWTEDPVVQLAAALDAVAAGLAEPAAETAPPPRPAAPRPTAPRVVEAIVPPLAAPSAPTPAEVAPSAAADAEIAPAPAPATAKATPMASERGRRRTLPTVLPDDIDIFSEPTRMAAPLGGDVFGDHGGRRPLAPRRPRAGESGFVGARASADEDDPWPWGHSRARPVETTRDPATDGAGGDEAGEESR